MNRRERNFVVGLLKDRLRYEADRLSNLMSMDLIDHKLQTKDMNSRIKALNEAIEKLTRD